MPIFRKNDVSVLFIHVPKTGGTTIEDTFLANGYQMTFRRGGRYGPRNAFDEENGCSPQHMHAALLERHFAGERFTRIFCLVRHPLARFLSEYRFRAESGHKLAQDGVDSFARQVLWRYARRDPMVLDNHIRPQVDFPWRSCTTFRLEDGIEAALSGISDCLPERLKPLDQTSMRSDPGIPAQSVSRDAGQAEGLLSCRFRGLRL